MKPELKISVDDAGEPVIGFTVSDKEASLESKLLGALIRKAQTQGIQLKLVHTYPNIEEKTQYVYHIRLASDDTDD